MIWSLSSSSDGLTVIGQGATKGNIVAKKLDMIITRDGGTTWIQPTTPPTFATGVGPVGFVAISSGRCPNANERGVCMHTPPNMQLRMFTPSLYG